jgi:hypothetical protein
VPRTGRQPRQADSHIDGYNLLNFASQIDDNTIEQAEETAAMPFVHPHIALLPDAHSGKGSANPGIDRHRLQGITPRSSRPCRDTPHNESGEFGDQLGGGFSAQHE